MRRRIARFTVATALASVIAFSGQALAATTISITVGPVTIPTVPVSICVVQTDPPANECVSTPPAQAVTVSLTITIGDVAPVIVPPLVLPIPCPAGTQGVALQIFTGTVSTVISGSVTITVNGTPTTIPIGQVVTTPGETVTLFVCAGVAPGV